MNQNTIVTIQSKDIHHALLNTIDFNNDGRVDFEDFLAFLLMPIHDWEHHIINKNETNKQPDRQMQFHDSIYLDPLRKTDVFHNQNGYLDENDCGGIKIKKDDYLHLNELLGDLFNCEQDEIDYTFKEILRFSNKEDEIDDSELQQTSEELQKGYLDEETWNKIVDDEVVIKHNVPSKREEINQRREL